MMDDLRERADQHAHVPGRGIDVDAVFLKGLGIEPDYVTLPNGILGRTKFLADGSTRVEISRELLEQAERDTVARRRLRSTLAHECGHVACHTLLHLKDAETGDLFSAAEPRGDPDSPPILCRATTLDQPGYGGDWWEYQANRCMAELLLPRRLFSMSLEKVVAGLGYSSFENAARGRDSSTATSALADEFDVSSTMIVYRLQDLGFLGGGDQFQMGLTG